MGLSGDGGSGHHAHAHGSASGSSELRRLRHPHSHVQPQPRSLGHSLDYAESAQLLEEHLRHNYLAYAAVAAANLEDEVHGPPSNNVPPSPVELMVTNLDQSIEQRELKSILITMFEPFKVRQINVFTQSDGNTSASVKMASLEDAQLAISRLHRSKVGNKRILINYNNTNTTNPAILRKKVISILKEVPEGRLQLFKFRDMFEKRYASSIGVSDLYKIKDVVSITEEVSGRIVCLNAYAKYFNDENNLESKCPIHAPSNEGEGWAEKEAGTQLPSVSVSLAILGPNLKQVLKEHQGSAPLYTILHCYNANSDYDPLEEDSIDGVPLEHLVSAVKGVQIVSNSSGIKSIVLVSPEEELSNSQTSHNQSLHSSFALNHPNNNGSVNLGPGGMPPTSLGGLPGGPNNLGHLTLTNQLNQLSRYLVDLLKSQKGTKILFQRFIPAYHHQFGTQLRVADYGYTKLKDLLEALPNVIQIIGEGSKSVITLTHRHQVKRFQSDMLKILKGQPNKQVALSEFPKI
ncbi:meiosis regulator and mRNA stability factor 1-like [Tigriopus californicus]|uniref:meiosis regulator and mRNA stability factor 1-like n=1 Tax=Tigriopus californicus TaxID=6832 RepID=UPI0027DA26B4|nr:meiosis regulator and mRNA stability factor 1-like [Tigriopus californicus]